MPLITIIDPEGKNPSLEVAPGTHLLDALRDHDIDLYAPCGGKGTCGKCLVTLQGEGEVTSCQYPVHHSINVILPDEREMEVLEKQHAYTRSLKPEPGEAIQLSPNPHGLAVDIGTTTIVCYLINLNQGTIIETVSGINPHIKYGADVISRIEYAGKGEKQLKELQQGFVNFFNRTITYLVSRHPLDHPDIVKISVAANNTMLHLLKGADPTPLALVPFTPRFTDQQVIPAQELKITMHPRGEVILLPSLSAYIGADVIAGLASLKPGRPVKNYLFLDIGTNGEIALVTEDKCICCATAAGPAFEGANISCGMGAVSGAIKAFQHNEYQVIGKVKPTGICGSGIIDIVAWMLETGILDKEGSLSSDYPIVPSANSGTKKDITITQDDIREVQLAKSAIISGVKILMKNAGVHYSGLDAIFLAGGFGNYINVKNAVTIGLLPREMQDKIIPLGNTSGAGAILALKSVRFTDILNELIRRTGLIELANDDDFMMEFAMNMNF